MSPTPYDHHVTDFGHALHDAAPAVRARRRRRTRRWVSAAALTTTGAGIAAAAVFAPAGGHLDVVAQAQAALGSPAGILNYSVKFDGGVVPKHPGKPLSAADERRRARNDRCKGAPPEIWETTTGPSRWRVRWPEAPCAIAGIRGHAFSGAYETSYASGALTTYDPAGNWLQIQTHLIGYEGVAPRLFADGLLNYASKDDDPADQIRGLLRAGKLRDTGTFTGAGGRELRRLIGTLPPDDSRSRSRIEYDIDAKSFAPVTLARSFQQRISVQGTTRTHRPKQLRTLRYTLTFIRYRRIPVTHESERLLAVQPPADVERVTTTSARLRRVSRTGQTAKERAQFTEAMRRHAAAHPDQTWR